MRLSFALLYYDPEKEESLSFAALARTLQAVDDEVLRERQRRLRRVVSHSGHQRHSD